MDNNAKNTFSVITEKTPISDSAKCVRDALIAAGLETPMRANNLSTAEKQQHLEATFADICNTLELDLTDDSLADTPKRIAKMYVQEVFSGLDYSNFPKISLIENKMSIDDMVMIKDIDLISTCEHHFITIDGVARIAYIPREKIIGLSKINRIVRFFAQRPQVQERLTKQILIALSALLDTPDIAVSINAVHYCVKARGVMDSNSNTSTVAVSGCFKTDKEMRREFIA